MDKKFTLEKKRKIKKPIRKYQIKKNPKHKKKKKTAHICSPIATHMPGTANCFFVWGGRDFYGKKKNQEMFYLLYPNYDNQVVQKKKFKSGVFNTQIN